MRTRLTALTAAVAAAWLAAGPAEAKPRGHDGTVFAIGKTVVIEEKEVVDEVVVIGGAADILGQVRSNVVVVGGRAAVTGKIGGDMVVAGGHAELGPSAVVEGDAVVVGGSLDADPKARILGDKTESFSVMRFDAFQRLADWFKSGLLYGRPLPPGVGWAWYAAAAFLLVNLFIAAVFPRPIELCLAVIETRPAGALLAGALGMALVGPLSLLLVISVAGIAILPVLLCGVVAAAWIGKIAVFRYAGTGIGQSAGLPELKKPLAAVAVGMAAVYLLYAVPLLGFAAWAAVTAFGFGAAILALSEAFSKESGAHAASDVHPQGGSSMSEATPPSVPSPVPSPIVAGEPARLPRAGFWERFGATAIDAFLFVVIGALIRVVSLGWLTWAIYQIGMWTWKGTTVGGIVFGLRGYRIDGKPMDFGVALVRHLSSYLSLAALGFGFFWAGWDPEKQSWHDKIAGTVVVKTPRGQPLI